MLKNNALNKILPNFFGDPNKEFKGRPLKHSCSDIFKTVNNS